MSANNGGGGGGWMVKLTFFRGMALYIELKGSGCTSALRNFFLWASLQQTRRRSVYIGQALLHLPSTAN